MIASELARVLENGGKIIEKDTGLEYDLLKARYFAKGGSILNDPNAWEIKNTEEKIVYYAFAGEDGYLNYVKKGSKGEHILRNTGGYTHIPRLDINGDLVNNG